MLACEDQLTKVDVVYVVYGWYTKRRQDNTLRYIVGYNTVKKIIDESFKNFNFLFLILYTINIKWMLLIYYSRFTTFYNITELPGYLKDHND